MPFMPGLLFRYVMAILFACLVGCTTSSHTYNASSDINNALNAGYPELDVKFDSPLLQQRKIVLTTDINPLSGRTILAHLLYLAERDPNAPIDFYINTSGGDLDIALAIIQLMRQIKPKVNTHAMVDVKSGGVLLVAAGTGRRIAYPSSLFTVHGGIASPGTPLDYKHKALDIYHRVILQTMDLPDAWFPLHGGVFHTMTAQQAVQYNVVDTIAMPTHQIPLRGLPLSQDQ